VIESVLIANRGEIAVRIIRTCRRLGIRAIAVYSDADAQAQHVEQADEAVHIGGSPATQSYLDVDRILAAARACDVRGVHPGYGFLSENPDVAERVVAEGLVWIGPSASAMRALGDKARAKALAVANDVPVLNGYHGEDQSLELLTQQAQRIGYPVLIKASAGGGGRGMRAVEAADGFPEALEAARREAVASFGDDRVLLERFVRRPRHVEIQVIGDDQGNIVHLGERECSIQRRHQKLIEESPSPAVDSALRERMGLAALRLARAAEYTNAGTVEFLLDEDGQFAFLEVNARLQVEHPVTEAITGLDLVELQLRIADGESLPFSQSDVKFDGHAIEVRVVAEDALAGFLPSSGRVERFEYPDTVRVDTWIANGTRVSPYYDSLLAKVIARAPTREMAITVLADALARTRLDGIRENIDLLLATLQTPEFVAGQLHTGFLDEHRIVQGLAEVPSKALAAAAATDYFRRAHVTDPWQPALAWRMARLDQPSTWTRGGREHRATITSDLEWDRSVQVHCGPATHRATLGFSGQIHVDDDPLSVTDMGDDLRSVDDHGRTYRLHRAAPPSVDEAAARGTAGAAGGQLIAPMPGRIVKVAVEPGQQVAQSQPLVVLEAMKMEHVVEAPHPGIVSEVHVAAGQQVAAGAPLLTLASA
jgi:3-methylcrotonyl-CoA carboxylase alpha subunit